MCYHIFTIIPRTRHSVHLRLTQPQRHINILTLRTHTYTHADSYGHTRIHPGGHSGGHPGGHPGGHTQTDTDASSDLEAPTDQ